MRSFFIKSTIAIATVLSLGLGFSQPAEALPGRGCPNFYVPFAYQYSQVVLPNNYLQITINAQDNDYSSIRDLRVYVNGAYYTTIAGGYWSGTVFPGIGLISFRMYDRNRCGAVVTERVVKEVRY